MRNFGNAIRNFYGELTIQSLAGAALTIKGVATSGYAPTMQVTAPNTTGQSNGLTITAGTNSSDAALVVQNAAASTNYYALLGDGSWSYSLSGATTLSQTSTGQVSISPPAAASGAALSINANSAALGLQVNGGTTSGTSYGVSISAGYTSSDYALYIQNRAASQSLFVVRGDGGVIVGGTTGDQGYGTLSALNGIYLNGNPIYAGTPVNAQNGGSYTAVLSDANKVIFVNRSGAQTVNIPSYTSVNYPLGTAITIINQSTANLTLTNADTMYFFPSNATGTRTFGNTAVGTLIKTQQGQWVLTGSGIT